MAENSLEELELLIDDLRAGTQLSNVDWMYPSGMPSPPWLPTNCRNLEQPPETNGSNDNESLPPSVNHNGISDDVHSDERSVPSTEQQSGLEGESVVVLQTVQEKLLGNECHEYLPLLDEASEPSSVLPVSNWFGTGNDEEQSLAAALLPPKPSILSIKPKDGRIVKSRHRTGQKRVRNVCSERETSEAISEITKSCTTGQGSIPHLGRQTGILEHLASSSYCDGAPSSWHPPADLEKLEGEKSGGCVQFLDSRNIPSGSTSLLESDEELGDGALKDQTAASSMVNGSKTGHEEILNESSEVPNRNASPEISAVDRSHGVPRTREGRVTKAAQSRSQRRAIRRLHAAAKAAPRMIAPISSPTSGLPMPEKALTPKEQGRIRNREAVRKSRKKSAQRLEDLERERRETEEENERLKQAMARVEELLEASGLLPLDSDL